ncbi:MAG: M67 family metallopeptidase [Actinobacteria bacterium]|nr:M67 family metallopeptidase [Actinomycetota bacterium]
MKFTQTQIDELIQHSRDDLPNECCGVIGSRDGVVETVYRAVNGAASPLRYELESRDLLRIFNAIDDADQEVGAIYHSHTRSAAYPSQTDINLALYPDALYIIVSLADAEAPDVKAFSIVDRKVSEVALEIVPG